MTRSHGAGSVRIRVAIPEDAVAIADCMTACWREAYAGLLPEPYLSDPAVADRRRQRWQARLTGERAVWLAETGGREVVGAVSAGPSRDDSRVGDPVPAEELMSLYVQAAWQGVGLGGRLLGAALTDRPASLWVLAANTQAQGSIGTGSPPTASAPSTPTPGSRRSGWCAGASSEPRGPVVAAWSSA